MSLHRGEEEQSRDQRINDPSPDLQFTVSTSPDQSCFILTPAAVSKHQQQPAVDQRYSNVGWDKVSQFPWTFMKVKLYQKMFHTKKKRFFPSAHHISHLDFLKISQKPRRKAENPNSEIKVLRMALCCPIPSFRSLVVTNKHCCEPGGWSWSVNMSTMSTATLTLFSPRNCCQSRFFTALGPYLVSLKVAELLARHSTKIV